MIFETYFFSKNGPKNKVQHFCVFLPSKMLHFAFGYLIALFFFEGSTFGSSLATQKPSFEIQANLCKVLFHFHSKLRLGPKSGFRKIDFSTTKRPLNIFLSIRNDSLADQTPIKRVISKTRFSRFLDTLTLFGRFEILTPKKYLPTGHG